MADQTARVLDANTQQIITIPASELAPGMMRVHIEGVEGDVFVEAGMPLAVPKSPVGFVALFAFAGLAGVGTTLGVE